jgi:phosphatidylglycerol---prolipoprotein diacylglyceryl transferase
MYSISFPGLGLNFHINPTAFKIGSFPIAWYGIIIAVGLLLAMIYGMKRAKEFNVTVDDLSDVIIFSIIFGVIGARLYYVLFYIDDTGVNPYFSDPLSIFNLRSGGLAIYGGMLAAFATAFIVCKIKKISVGAVYDIAALGFLIGQAIGRWGNFVNEEAYGSATNLPWRMLISASTDAVHPCFLYESLWCILGFVLLHMYSKHRK